MKYKLLGRSGLRVSEVCLGTMTFGEAWGWGAGNDECRKIFDAYVSAGGNFIDTANFYTNGESETIVGDLVGAQRDEFVLATKYSLNVRPGDPNGGGNHRKSMRQSIEASLRRLKTDYIDLYWVHVWDYLTPVDEVMRGLDDLVRAGKILYAGISDSPAWVISQANTLADLQGWSPFVGIQLQYNLIERSIEPEFFPMAKQHDLILMAWSPLAGGLLTGKYHTDKETPSDARGQQTGGAALTERKTRIVTKVLEVAKALGRSPSQVALNWTRQNAYGLPVIPILGAKKLSQLKDNLGSLDFSISAEHLSALNAVSSYESAFPHNFLRTKMVDSFLYGGTLDAIDNHRPLTLPVAAPLPTVHIYQSGETGIFANAYLVETAEHLVAIDSTLLESTSKEFSNQAKAIGKPLKAVLLTHGHPDHYNGVTNLINGAAVDVVATEGVDKVIREYDVAKERQWAGVFGEEWPRKRTFPNRILGDGDHIEVDGVRFTVRALGPGESHSDSYWIVESNGHRVAFIGDAVLNQVHAYVTDGHTTQWLKNLSRLKTELQSVETIYPGHGDAGGPELLDWEKAYLEEYRKMVASLAQGNPTLTNEQKQQLTAHMDDYLQDKKLEFLIGSGADPVAAELAHELRSQVGANLAKGDRI